MAVVIPLSTTRSPTGFNSFSSHPRIGNRRTSSFCTFINKTQIEARHHNSLIINKSETNPEQNHQKDKEVKTNSVGVEAALTMLKFYKREISPLLPKSCRYVPTCSEYSMEAYKKYGVVKGTILTAWRLCRCNPLGGSGFDPPRWFDEEPPPQEE